MMIVDDAHKLTVPALMWLFDFHDETLCPVAMVGTFALIDKLAADPQRARRVGLHFELKARAPRALIGHLVRQLVSEVGSEFGELCDLCESVAELSGRYGNVHQQLKLAVELRGSSPRLTWCRAFEAAAPLMPNRQKTP